MPATHSPQPLAFYNHQVLSYVCQELKAALTNSDAVREGLGVLVGDALGPDVDVKGKTQAISSATNT